MLSGETGIILSVLFVPYHIIWAAVA